MNPTRGHKRPSREATIAVRGHFSSRQIHQKITTMSNDYEEFFAEKGGNTDSDNDEDD